MTADRCRLYLVTPPRVGADFPDLVAAALDGGDVACLQLRLKEAGDDEVRRVADALLPLAGQHGVALLINDRPDLAREVGADGVHIGQDDADYATARKLLGPDAIVGVTCHDSRHLAMEAAEAGADYVAFGAFHPTATKTPKSRADPEILSWWSELFVVPCVAIGGITLGNCAALARAGADFVAVVSAVWDHPQGPGAAVRAFNEVLEKAVPQAAAG